MDRTPEKKEELRSSVSGQGKGPPPPRFNTVGTGGPDDNDENNNLPDIGVLREVGGVVDSLVIGHDGILLKSDCTSLEPEDLGVWALGVYMNTDHVTRKMGHNNCHCIIARSTQGYLIIADMGASLLVTTYDASEPDTLTQLLGAVLRLCSRQL